ncbi:MAG: bacterioferritin-associated ferredoxin [Arenicella sp.]|jgi:bacterioferritin-associated ferredoxin
MCYGITDKQIKNAVETHGVGNMRELKQVMALGSQCGKCLELAQDIIDSTIMDESLFKCVG